MIQLIFFGVAVRLIYVFRSHRPYFCLFALSVLGSLYVSYGREGWWKDMNNPTGNAEYNRTTPPIKVKLLSFFYISNRAGYAKLYKVTRFFFWSQIIFAEVRGVFGIIILSVHETFFYKSFTLKKISMNKNTMIHLLFCLNEISEF